MIMNNEEDFSGFWPSAVCNVITFYSYITLRNIARISVHAWIQNSYGGGGAKIVLSAGGQRLIFVILLLRCEFNQFEFLRKPPPPSYQAAHGLKYETFAFAYNYFTKGDHQTQKQKQVQRNNWLQRSRIFHKSGFCLSKEVYTML